MDLFPKYFSKFVAHNLGSVLNKVILSGQGLKVEESGSVEGVTRTRHQQKMRCRGGGLGEKTAQNLRLTMEGNLRDLKVHRLRFKDTIKGTPQRG